MLSRWHEKLTLKKIITVLAHKLFTASLDKLPLRLETTKSSLFTANSLIVLLALHISEVSDWIRNNSAANVLCILTDPNIILLFCALENSSMCFSYDCILKLTAIVVVPSFPEVLFYNFAFLNKIQIFCSFSLVRVGVWRKMSVWIWKLFLDCSKKCGKRFDEFFSEN